MTRLIHLERVSERFILELSFKLGPDSPLHIGAGSEGTNKILLKFQVNGKDLPLIPAESLKGVLRSLAFSLSRQILLDNLALKYHVKDRHVKRKELKEDEQKEIVELHLEKAKEHLGNIMPRDVVKEIGEDKLQLLEYYFALNCPVCRLFGAQGMAGKLIFTDGIPNAPPKLLTYTATSINRKTRIVEEGRLFSLTAVEPREDLRYRVKIIADNIYKGSEEAKIFSRLLSWILKFGLQVGGLKSYGYGRVFIDKDESIAKILNLREDANSEIMLNNVRALLLKDGYFQALKIDDFVKWLE